MLSLSMALVPLLFLCLFGWLFISVPVLELLSDSEECENEVLFFGLEVVMLLFASMYSSWLIGSKKSTLSAISCSVDGISWAALQESVEKFEFWECIFSSVVSGFLFFITSAYVVSLL